MDTSIYNIPTRLSVSRRQEEHAASMQLIPSSVKKLSWNVVSSMWFNVCICMHADVCNQNCASFHTGMHFWYSYKALIKCLFKWKNILYGWKSVHLSLWLVLDAGLKNISLIQRRPSLWWEKTGKCPRGNSPTPAGCCQTFPTMASEEVNMSWTWIHSDRISDKLHGHFNWCDSTNQPEPRRPSSGV